VKNNWKALIGRMMQALVGRFFTSQHNSPPTVFHHRSIHYYLFSLVVVNILKRRQNHKGQLLVIYRLGCSLAFGPAS
jgi:hypothetical protein